MFRENKEIRKELEALKNQLAEYHAVVVRNHTDLAWIKGGLTICLPVLITLVINSCGGYNATSDNNKDSERIDKKKSESFKPYYWTRANND